MQIKGTKYYLINLGYNRIGIEKATFGGIENTGFFRRCRGGAGYLYLSPLK